MTESWRRLSRVIDTQHNVARETAGFSSGTKRPLNFSGHPTQKVNMKWGRETVNWDGSGKTQ